MDSDYQGYVRSLRTPADGSTVREDVTTAGKLSFTVTVVASGEELTETPPAR